MRNGRAYAVPAEKANPYRACRDAWNNSHPKEVAAMKARMERDGGIIKVGYGKYVHPDRDDLIQPAR